MSKPRVKPVTAAPKAPSKSRSKAAPHPAASVAAKPAKKAVASAKSESARAAAAKAAKENTTSLVRAAKGASAADRERAEALLSEIARRKQRIAEDFYDIGEGLRDLQKKKLFAALGYASFAAMLQARKVMSLSQAYKLIRIVTTLPREKALAVGSEKAALLAGYSDATEEPDTPEWLLDEGKLPDGKRVADASTRELADATRKARSKKPAKKATPEEANARAEARKAQVAIRKRGVKAGTVEALRKGGKWWLRFEVPVEGVVSMLGA